MTYRKSATEQRYFLTAPSPHCRAKTGVAWRPTAGLTLGDLSLGTISRFILCVANCTTQPGYQS